MNLIRGEFLPTIADKVLFHYGKLYCDPNSIENGDIVYCDTHDILRYKDILNTKSNLIIITHNSDHCLYDSIDDDIVYTSYVYPDMINTNELTCYHKWFGQNSYSLKVNPLPIGFENIRWEESFGPKTKWLKNARDNMIEPTSLVYLNCNINTNIAQRKRCYNLSSEMGIVNIDKSNLTYVNYLDKIKEHKFILSPRGNGLDCHRTWEILMLKRIPIIKREGQMEKLYEGMPVLFVDDWKDILNMNLDEIYNQFCFDEQEYLNFEFWKMKILSRV